MFTPETTCSAPAITPSLLRKEIGSTVAAAAADSVGLATTRLTHNTTATITSAPTRRTLLRLPPMFISRTQFCSGCSYGDVPVPERFAPHVGPSRILTKKDHPAARLTALGSLQVAARGIIGAAATRHFANTRESDD